jgi:hypothetical protein
MPIDYRKGMEDFNYLIDRISDRLPQDIRDEAERNISIFRLSGKIEPLSSELRFDFCLIVPEDMVQPVYKLRVSEASLGVLTEIDWPVTDSFQIKKILTKLNIKFFFGMPSRSVSSRKVQ